MEPTWVEYVGIAILGGILLQVALDVYGGFSRRQYAARRQKMAVTLFEERARLDLDAVVRERMRREFAWEGLRKFKIDRKVEEAESVCSFYLTPHDGKPIPPFLPGQYLTFQLKIPGQPRAVTRCYSLSDSPTERDYYRVTIKRIMPPPNVPDGQPGLVSSFFHSLDIGELVDVRAPAGNFYLDTASNRPVVLIGGGVGLTPVLSMLNTICRSGSKRETWFFYGIINRKHHAMYDHLQRIAREHENVKIVVAYSNPTESCVRGQDYQEQGYADVNLIKRLLPSNNYEYYICGPPPMMTGITKGLQEWGVPEADIHYEAFGPASVQPAAKAAPVALADPDTQIFFARTGKTIAWKASDKSILDVAEANGIVIDSGCRAGNCGTCETAIRSGTVSYPHAPGLKPKEGSCLACVAMPKGKLVIDA
jgi:ferredoxin-NADP reductase